MKGWIGVDLDGTLAHYEGWVNECHIGTPIPIMVDRVKTWLAEGREVKIFTARVWDDNGNRDVSPIRERIQAWCLMHIGRELEVTCQKDYGMIELWDDRAVRVVANTGIVCCDVRPE